MVASKFVLIHMVFSIHCFQLEIFIQSEIESYVLLAIIPGTYLQDLSLRVN